MPTIKQSLYFNYDGVSCRDFGLVHVNLDGGMFEENLSAPRSIVETEMSGNDTPLFHRVEESPLEFEMTIAFEGKYTEQEIDNVLIWLFKNSYRPLYFEDNPERIFYCMPVGDARMFHNGLKEGYMTFTMRNKSSKILSPQKTTQAYTVSSNTTSTNITIQNSGHVEIMPEISIEKINSGKVTITKDGEIFEIINLNNGEKIYINCEKEIIETDIIGVNRYGDVIGDYHDMELSLGSNVFRVTGTCKITFRYVLKYRF